MKAPPVGGAFFILRSRLNYQFSRELSLRLIVQYNDFYDDLDLEPLLTYRLNPFTVFYVGATSNFHYYDSSDYDSVSASEWAATSRQFFFKMQYLFQI
ncbi:MAG: hypothetical protein KAT79_00745 [candidate division Zixibacteria bacterium]|nr:hypothetical protein [candidate division Zixibacteria bacterium]